MKRNGSIALLVVCGLCFLATASGEYVFLRDGKIIEGTIVRENALSVMVRTKDKKTETFTRGNIMRILYTELYMGKVFVQKTDGKGVTGYMVDEDRKTYTFRRELFNPAEFTIQRDKVLFIARRNPSGLEGEAETDLIRLKWLPPYNQVKNYRIYIKGPGEYDFKKAAETSRRHHEMEDLKSNSRYTMYVTAVAAEGDESLPSNEITVTTKNIPPERPGRLRIEERGVTVPAREKKGAATIAGEKRPHLVWEQVRDVDGRVQEYRVYNVKGERPVRIATTTSPAYELPADYASMRLAVRAVDDKGDESGERVLFTESPAHVRAGGGAAFPFSTMADYAKTGYGGMCGLYFSGYLFKALAFGADAGYVHWMGNDDRVDSIRMAPFSAWIGLRFRLCERVAVIPAAHAGVVYLTSSYEYTPAGSATTARRERTGWDGLAGGSLAVEFDITERIFVYLRGEYSVIIEKESQSFAAAMAGAGLHLPW